MRTPNQPVPSGINTTPPDSTLSWRCPAGQRLHRDDAECTDSPPSSPIIDTLSKRMRMEMKNAGLHPNSQATTQPTPSRAQPRPQGRGRPAGTCHSSTYHDHDYDAEAEWINDAFSIPEGLMVVPYIRSSISSVISSFGKLWARNTIPPMEAGKDGYQVIATPADQTSNLDRIPETLPRLTTGNLPALDNNNGTNATSGTNPANGITPSMLSIPSFIAGQISRLVLRCRIERLNHEAASAHLARVEQELEDAKEAVAEEALRAKIFRRLAWAFFMLALSLLVFYWWHEDDRDFIRAIVRAHFRALMRYLWST